MAISNKAITNKKNSGASSTGMGGTAVAEPPRSGRGGGRRGASEAVLCRRYGITEQNLSSRRQFLRLDESDRELMIELIPWAKSAAAEISREFYEWQFNFDPTLQFFEVHAEEKEISLEELREHLERAQAKYFVEVFEGAHSNWGIDHFERRLKVGKLHDQINLPLKWYLGSYAEYAALLPKYLKEATKDPVKALRAERVIAKIFNLDQQAVADAFVLSVVESSGFNLDAIDTEGDKGECMADIKASLKHLTDGVTLLAQGEFSSDVLDQETCDRAGIGHLGALSTSLRTFLSEMQHMAAEHAVGEIDATLPAAKFEGAYREMAEGVNRMVALTLDANNKAMVCLGEIGRGNFDSSLEQFPGKRASINNVVEELRGNLRGLILEMDHMSAEHNLGDIEVLIPAEKFQGSYRTMAQGINDMVAGHITVKKKAMACVAEFGRGNFEAQLETFPGKKAFINKVVEELRGNLRGLITEMDHMSAQHNAGDIEVVIPAEKFQGSYRTMAQGINDMVSGHITVKKKAMACVAELGRGNFEAQLETFPGKKAFINKVVEDLRGNLRGLITEIDHMSAEHNAGDIEVVIPAEKFQGSYRTMAQGINDMVAGHITVKKKAMACVAEFGRGNFDAELEAFPGKKAFINQTIESVRRNLKLLIKDVDFLSASARDGEMEARADAGRHDGGFRKIIETINSILQMLVDPLRTVAQNSQTLASSAEELSAVSQQMAGNAEETAMQANVVSAASEEVSKNVTTVATSAEQMQASIREIAKNANEAARVAKNAVSVASQTNVTVSKLGESSTEIGNVIKVITSIAQQTNLLALNATIEAARAGEAGKGFAVVANEVKELAKQTAKATEEIGQKIEAIQGDTKGAVKAIAEISAIIDQINDISNSIASAVEEQTVTTNEIGRSVAEAAKGTGDIAKNISGVAVAAKNTTQGASDTQKASQELSRMAALLQGVVAKFTF